MIPRPSRSTPVPKDEWVAMMTRLYMDGPHGPACCEVVRRFVAGEIEDRSHARGIVRRGIDAEMDEEAG